MDKVQHFEIPFEDKDRAQGFYEKVFGWGIEKYPGDMPYWIARTVDVDDKFMPKESGVINGGMYERGAEGAQGPVIVITVDDIDASIEKLEESGGKVVFPKRDIGGMGLYAQFKDTEGNIMGIWQNLKKE